MRVRKSVLTMMVLLVPSLAHAGGVGVFGLLRDGIIVSRDLWVVTPALNLSLEDGGGEGLVAGVSRGLTPSLDFAGKVALFDEAIGLGGEVNYQAFRRSANRPFDLSIGGGFSFTNVDGGGDTTSVNVLAVGSREINEQFTFYGGLSIAFGNVDSGLSDELEDLFDVDTSFTAVHLVPGAQYRLNERFDVIGEIGIGLTDEAGSYLAVGVNINLR